MQGIGPTSPQSILYFPSISTHSICRSSMNHNDALSVPVMQDGSRGRVFFTFKSHRNKTRGGRESASYITCIACSPSARFHSQHSICFLFFFRTPYEQNKTCQERPECEFDQGDRCKSVPVWEEVQISQKIASQPSGMTSFLAG